MGEARGPAVDGATFLSVRRQQGGATVRSERGLACLDPQVGRRLSIARAEHGLCFLNFSLVFLRGEGQREREGESPKPASRSNSQTEILTEA